MTGGSEDTSSYFLLPQERPITNLGPSDCISILAAMTETNLAYQGLLGNFSALLEEVQ